MPAAAEEKGLTLRDVADELRAWADTIDGMEEDAPEREQAIAIQARAITQSRDKVEGFARFLLRLEAESEFAKSESTRLAARVKRIDALREKLREYAVDALRGAELRRIDGHTLALSLRKGPETALITDEASVPSRYKTLVITVPAVEWEQHLVVYQTLARHYNEMTGMKEYGDVPAITRAASSTEIKIDKRKLLADLKTGEEIVGADLAFGRESLVIR